MKYGILGCGGHALLPHAIPGKQVQSLSLVAICDRSREAMRSFCSDFGSSVPMFDDERQFFRSGIDAVVIVTPDQFHAQNLRDAVSAGLHVLVEKPLAIDSHQLAMVRADLRDAAEQGLVVMSCHPRRFDPPFVWLYNNMDGLVAELGSVLHFGFDFSYHMPNAAWKQDRSLLLDHCCHEIDLLSFLFGYRSFSAKKLKDSFDRYEVIGSRIDGISFRFHGTRRLASREFSEWVTVRYERGEVRLDAHTGLVEILSHETGTKTVRECGATNYLVRCRAVMENFAAAISRRGRSYLTFDDLEVNTATGVGLVETGFVSMNDRDE